MAEYSSFLPGFSIEQTGFDSISKMIRTGSHIAILGGNTATLKAKIGLINALEKRELSFFWTGGECNQSNHDRLVQDIHIQNCDWIIGVGGGRALDLSKWVADSLQKPILCVPTIASTCAACSSVSVIYDEHHQFVRIHELAQAPQHVVLNTSILVEAPPKYLHAGIGDAISKPLEIAFSGKNRAWSYTNWMGKTIAEGALHVLLEQGEAAYQSNLNQIVDSAFKNIVCSIIMGIGHASILVEEDYNSALAHALYNALMRIEGVKGYPHGVIVSYGVLVQCLIDEDQSRFKQLYSFYRTLALPISLEGIGCSIEHPELGCVIEHALQMPDCKLVAKELSVTQVFNAMRMLEDINNERVSKGV